jgi:hypothetical protein
MPSPRTTKAPRYRTLNSSNFWHRLADLFVRNEIADRGINGFMFETFGPEMDLVREIYAIAPKRIVTIIEGDTGRSWWVCNGFHYVNRIGYLLLKENAPAPPEFKDFRC